MRRPIETHKKILKVKTFKKSEYVIPTYICNALLKISRLKMNENRYFSFINNTEF